MKKLIISLALLLSPCIAFCQYFELTPNGIESAAGDRKKYVILDFPGKTKTELFDIARQYMINTYISAKDVMSESAPSVITVNAMLPFKYSNGFYRYDALCNYKFSVAFKNDKIRVEFNLLNFEILPTNGIVAKFTLGLVRSGMNAGIFKKNGEIVKVGSGKETKEFIEDRFNSLTQGLFDAIKGENIDTNW